MFNSSQPVPVSVSFRINLLFSVDSKNELFTLDLFTREVWSDERLRFDQSMWPVEHLGLLRIPTTIKVWKPDTFFYNAVSCTISDQLLTLSYLGQLTWIRHQNCVFHVSFNLLNFPFDTQTLVLRRLSFAYNENELVLRAASPCYQPDPSNNYQNSLWDLTSWSCENNFFGFRSSQAPYTQVTANLFVSRKYENYIVKMIAPMFVITLLSTLTFWIDANSPPARVGATVTLVLSIVTFNLVVSQDLPKINYSTLLDWYVWKCFIFVVFAVAEFACVNYILSSKTVPEQVGRLIDDWCSYTVPITWILSNCLFWPFIQNPFLFAFVVFIYVFYFSFNVIRTYWNYKNGKRGGWEILGWLRQKYRERRQIIHRLKGLVE
jgi:hypothetical protein